MTLTDSSWYSQLKSLYAYHECYVAEICDNFERELIVRRTFIVVGLDEMFAWHEDDNFSNGKRIINLYKRFCDLFDNPDKYPPVWDWRIPDEELEVVEGV